MDQVQRIFPEGMPKAVGPYSTVTCIGNLLFVSGQLPLNPISGTIESQSIEDQAHQCMKNLKNAVQGSGSGLDLIAKTTILLVDMGVFPKVNEIYSAYFEKDKYPARACFAVAALPKNAKIQIQAIAAFRKIQDIPKKKIKTE